METTEFLKKVSVVAGVSGFESSIAQFIKEEFCKYCDDVKIDKFGNLIAFKKGKGMGKIMFSAHMDEIGMMVSHIDDEGFVKFTNIGNIDSRTILSQEVVIHGREEVYGVIGLKPPHLSKPEEMKKAIEMDKLSIDTGYPADRLKELIDIGDTITITRKVVELQNGKFAGRAFDNIAGVVALLAAMNNLKDYNHTADVYFVASAQEEIGGRGAMTATYQVEPDIGIAIDVEFAKTPELNEIESVEMDKGPAIGVGLNVHPKVYEKLKDTAKKNNIDYQIVVYSKMSGTDAREIEVTGGGVASGIVSIPLKYMHTAVETVSSRDIELTGRLISDFVIGLNNCDMEAVLCY